MDAAIARLSRFWWLVAARGMLGTLFGIAALGWPAATLTALVLFFGAYMFADGSIALLSAIRFRHERESWAMLLLEGIIGLATGAVTFVWPGITALAWVLLISAWALVTGLLEIITAVRIYHEVMTALLLGVSGIVSLIFGVAMAAFPLIGLVVWIYMIGIYAVAFGLLLLVAAARLRNLHPHGHTEPPRPPGEVARTTG